MIPPGHLFLNSLLVRLKEERWPYTRPSDVNESGAKKLNPQEDTVALYQGRLLKF
jgi:hypothetical protein